ncbi:LysR substrate-binding domain-containing protein [Massilia solisilvae]|uniref:LysR substrate-binding domain-containing protein n=1 Tax=Massilia solisilvae TaxID=1811225 RepID=UPI0027D9ADE0|nr:LysR substrate-binding domain-containing protein [Massilia solisilvae]
MPDLVDLRVFVETARRANFTRAAEALDASAAYVTKRIQVLEQNLGVKLFHRSTRKVVVTEEGERIYQWAQQILDAVDGMVAEVSVGRAEPRGALRICSSFGFGRNIVAPAISQLSARYPQLKIRFEVFDRLVDITNEGFDLDVRVGDEIAPHLIARRLAPNHRVLCAAPGYLARRGTPRTLGELASHDCLIIKERDHPFGVWRLRDGTREEVIKVTGPLSSNNGEVVVQWAVGGRGIALRSMWDIAPLLESGKLVRVLPEFTQEANVWAVYPSKLGNSAKLRVCVDWLQESLQALIAQRQS